MNVKTLSMTLLLGLFVLGAALLTANAQYSDTKGGSDQILVNQPANAAQAGNLMPQAGMAKGENFAQQPYAYADPYLANGVCAPAAGLCAAPLAAPCAAAPVLPCGPFTGGFAYSTQQSSAFGPFTPPVAQASEQFYQFPGLSPCGAYPGTGYAATGGVGFDPASGYYGPYGGFMPL